MKLSKILTLAVLSLSLIGNVPAQARKNKLETGIKKNDDKAPFEYAVEGVKTISEGAYSKIEKPFVFVARSPETYAQMRKMAENLPSELNIDFSNTAVVAAFAGTKNTGGYSVSVKKANDKIKIEVVAPPKNAMVAESLTTPYRVALVSVEPNSALPLEMSSNWKSSVQTFKVSKAEFEYAGGIAGRGKKFPASGTINVINYENFATFVFALSGKANDRDRKIFDAASGTLAAGKIDLARLDAGSFAESPKSPVRVSGTISGRKLSLTFDPLPPRVADGFQLRGKIEAIKL